MPRRVPLCVRCALLALAALLGVESPARSTESRIAMARAELEQRTDGDSLAAAALLTPAADAGERLALVSRAVSIAPDRPELVWLQLMLCQEARPCHSQPFEQHLRALDPLNGAPWLAALSRVGVAGDPAAVAEALDGLAASERVDIYWNRLIRALSTAAYETGQVPLDEAVIAVIGVLAARAIPAYQGVTRACRADALNAPGRLGQCREIARSLRNGDTVITEMVGVVIVQRVWPEGTPEWQAATDERRAFEDRSASALAGAAAGNDVPSLRRYLALCGQYRRQQDVVRAQLQESAGGQGSRTVPPRRAPPEGF